MKTSLSFVYYLILVIAAITGMLKYKYLDSAMRIIVVLLTVTCLCELLSYVTMSLHIHHIRDVVFHIYGIVEMFLQALFFIYAIKPYHYRKLIVANAILWPLIGLLNIIYLQPVYTLNSNMLLCESFSTITLSLYFIYWQLRNDREGNLFAHPHFRIAILLLLLWSSTFFFWAFIIVLYRNKWPHYMMVSHVQVVINILVYAGIGLTLFFYPKNLKTLEND